MRLYFRDLWGHRTTDVLLARLLALMFNIHREKDTPAMTEDDVLPRMATLLRAATPAEPAVAAEPASTGADLFSFLAEVRG